MAHMVGHIGAWGSGLASCGLQLVGGFPKLGVPY